MERLMTTAVVAELQEIIQEKLDLNAKDKFGYAPLHKAITHGLTDQSLNLIASGADLLLQDKQGYTPLHYAAEYGNLEVAKAILDKDTQSLQVTNVFGERPLYQAIRNIKEPPFKMVELLLQKGANQSDANVLEWVSLCNIDELTQLFADTNIESLVKH